MSIFKKLGAKLFQRIKRIGRPQNSQRPRVPQNTSYYRGRQVTTNASQKRLKQKNEYRRKRLSQQKRSELLTQVKLVATYTALVLLGILILQRSQIRSYQFEGLAFDDEQLASLEELSGEYISGITAFKPFFSETKFAEYMLENTTYAANIEARTSFFSTTVTVDVEPKQAALVYSSTDASVNELAVAQDGTLVGLQPTDEVTTKLIDTSGVEYEQGDTVVSERQIRFMIQLIDEFRGYNHEIKSFQITDQPKEINIRLIETDYFILVNQDRSPASLAGDYEGLVLSLPQQGREISSYVDLRVVDKAFYK